MADLADLNAMAPDDFTATLGGVFEHSPWVAARAARHRPFDDVAALHRALCAVVSEASEAEQRALLQAHPDLAGRLARAGTLTPDSAAEQGGLGLDRLSSDEFERFDSLNRAYRAKFGFPFIAAVRRHDRQSLLAAFEARLRHDPASERLVALDEVALIARYRLQALA
ncbi:2-oxo-4-hydroxy-4-carboxy-5-ureidoimidazoline decarboxylase [Lichenicoccus sp.]|uniref:2-oxo-4-hydroxy-4-carboxy-5-ureidoimidazoline decarboxylase n=1 Tax=Lichenicoccus sp. TaxID=2781899 RepID=UPI003D14C9B8